MTPRQVVNCVLEGGTPPYVPWSFRFTAEPWQALVEHLGDVDAHEAVGNHLLEVGSPIGFFEQLDNDRFRDVFGVVWDRSQDKDIGNVEGCVLPEPTLSGYTFPNPEDDRFFADIEPAIERFPDRYRLFTLGFSLFERAWTLRGMENLMLDMIENPEFVDDLLDAIADYDIAQVNKATTFDIDGVYFGDDWGQQCGLIMGPEMWRRFIRPRLERMYSAVRSKGKHLFIHSCGDVDELFDDLVEMGLNCFNPFQPEVMDIHALHAQYLGRLSFWGGLSMQKTLPFGSADDVRRESAALLAMGQKGGYIFSPSHAVEGDTTLKNILPFIEAAQAQPGAPKSMPAELLAVRG